MSSFFDEMTQIEQEALQEALNEKRNKQQKENEKEIERKNAQRAALQQELSDAKNQFIAAVASLRPLLDKKENETLVKTIHALINQSTLIVEGQKHHKGIPQIETMTNILHWARNSLQGKANELNDETTRLLFNEIKKTHFLDKRRNRIFLGIALAITAIALGVIFGPHLWHIGVILSRNPMAEVRCMAGMLCFYASIFSYIGAGISSVGSVLVGLSEKPGSVGGEVKTLTELFKTKPSSSITPEVLNSNATITPRK